jgi:hypothetical protein
MIKSTNSNIQTYFSRPAFRSAQFVVSTIFVWGLAVHGVRDAIWLAAKNGCLSDQIVVLAFLPVGLWAYSLYLHGQIRKTVGNGFGELSGGWWGGSIHATLPGWVALFLWSTISAIVNCRGV